MLLVLGTLLRSRPRPWTYFEVPALLVNSYEILKNEKLYLKIREKGGIKKFLDYDGIVYLDSGGFQAMRHKFDIDLKILVKIYKTSRADYYFSLDYPSPKAIASDDDVLRTITNYKKLRKSIRDVIPVVHPPYERMLKEFEAYMEYDPPVMAIGGLVPLVRTVKGVPNGRKRAIEMIASIRERFDHSLHIMGLGAPTVIPILKTLRCDSTDSASWRVKAAHGKIMLPNGGERYVSNRTANFGVVKLKEEEMRELEKLDCQILKEFGWEGITNSFEVRALFNAWITLYSNNGEIENDKMNGPFAKLLTYATELMNDFRQ